MRKPLSPYGNLKDDIFYWIKEYLGSKVLEMKIDEEYKKTFNRDTEYQKVIASKNMEALSNVMLDIRKNGIPNLGTYIHSHEKFYKFIEKEKKLQSIREFNTEYRDTLLKKNDGSYSTNTLRSVLVQINSLFIYIENNAVDIDGDPYFFNLGLTETGEKTELPVAPFLENDVKYIEPYELLHLIAMLDTFPFRGENIDKNKLMIKLLLFTGLRLEELGRLKQKDIELTENPTPLLDDGIYLKLTIKGGSKKLRYAYIKNSLINKEYVNYIADANLCSDGLLFCTKENKQYTPSAITAFIKNLWSHAELKENTSQAQTLRYSFAAYLLIKDVDIEIVQTLVGLYENEVEKLYDKIEKIKHEKA